tara:strand:+ start:321 stop:503 length:183 start_codon:yes stop_codon:yes gene_type:complete
MVETLSADDLFALHVKQFGVDPVITGINASTSGDLLESIIDALETGVPYIEQEVPEEVKT